MKEVILAGGCFWCIESDLNKLKGVIEAVSGYTGGPIETANYDDVCTGQSGHVEAVKVVYDELVVSYENIIEYFWTCIDPTNPYGQFADMGPQYQTVVYYGSEEEKAIAEHSKKLLDLSGRFEDPVMTKIEKTQTFYPAEEYHQQYSKKNPIHYENYRIRSGRAGYINIVWKDMRAENDI